MFVSAYVKQEDLCEYNKNTESRAKHVALFCNFLPRL